MNDEKTALVTHIRQHHPNLLSSTLTWSDIQERIIDENSLGFSNGCLPKSGLSDVPMAILCIAHRAAHMGLYFELDDACNGRRDLVEALRTIRALAKPNPEPLDNQGDRLQDALRRLRAVASLAGLRLSPYEGECGLFPWRSAEELPAPHLRCVKPAGHKLDHRAEDGLTWPQKDGSV